MQVVPSDVDTWRELLCHGLRAKPRGGRDRREGGGRGREGVLRDRESDWLAQPNSRIIKTIESRAEDERGAREREKERPEQRQSQR
jgi:hypothetical protein